VKLSDLFTPVLGLGLGAVLLLPTEEISAWAVTGDNLGLGNRDFRIFNNFTSGSANNNQTTDPQFPGYQGAVMAIWKASVEWGSLAHGDGSGDPTQANLGDGGANFDPSFQGQALGVGSSNENIHSEISGNGNGVLAYCELPTSDGWRIRYFQNWNWADGPGTINTSEFDLQGIAGHEYGHALGLAHTSVGGATMFSPVANGDVSLRSIDPDDIAGCQAVYGVMSGSKPTITDVTVIGTIMTITGTNFSPSNNKVWLTQAAAGGSGNPLLLPFLQSNGTTITAVVPGPAGPGDILVQSNGNANTNLSNAWPDDLSGGGCVDPVTYCGTTPNSVGAGAIVGFVGTSSVSANNLAVFCTGLVPNKPGLFFYGPLQSSLTLGDGVRCVDGALTRMNVHVSNSTGAVWQGIDWNAPPFDSGPGQVGVGDHVNFQYWYRDPPGGAVGNNLSNALELVLCN
jgi:hypothetical protein